MTKEQQREEVDDVEKSEEIIRIFNEIKTICENRITIPNDIQIVYQYTNIEALLNGIIVKEPKNANEDICLWASNALYMNDPEEIMTGGKFINEILDKFIENKDGKETDLSLAELEHYITSFSMTKDSLPMWGMYGKNGNGVALGFDVNVIKEKHSGLLYNCVYIDQELKSMIISLCEKIKGEKIPEEGLSITIVILLFALLFKNDTESLGKIIEQITPFLIFSACAKNDAYRYENEIRLLKQLDENSVLKFRHQNNLVVPYIENYLPKESLKEIWVGPTNDIERTIKSLKTYLDHSGFTDVAIIPSEVPYRG